MIKKEPNIGATGPPGGIWLNSFSMRKRTQPGRDCNFENVCRVKMHSY